VTCAACHRVNEKGVAVQLRGTEYAQDYRASVVLLHVMHEGDRQLSIKKRIGKYPYRKSQKIVQEGWER
jgi:mono/diheme cytochrome c family protein